MSQLQIAINLLGATLGGSHLRPTKPSNLPPQHNRSAASSGAAQDEQPISVTQPNVDCTYSKKMVNAFTTAGTVQSYVDCNYRSKLANALASTGTVQPCVAYITCEGAAVNRCSSSYPRIKAPRSVSPGFDLGVVWAEASAPVALSCPLNSHPTPSREQKAMTPQRRRVYFVDQSSRGRRPGHSQARALRHNQSSVKNG